MGTSLSGLTPATTFDGLLKVGDNDPLTADLKAISTGDGTDTILSLSDSALQVNGDLNVGSVHKIYQDANNLNIIGNSGTTALKYFTNFGNNNTNEFGLNNFFRYSVGIGFTNVQSTARLNVKGSGATSATTSLLVQNSAGDDSLKITDDNNVLIGNSTTGGIHNVDSASSLPFTVSRLGIVRFSVSSDSGNGQIVLKSNTNNEFSVGTNGNIFQINDGANTNQGSKRFSIIQDGNIGIGDVSPTAKLHVKGSGNDNTTTSLLVQNSDGTNALSIGDDRTSIFWANANLKGNTYGNAFYLTTAGNLKLGEQAPASARLHVKGSGNDATTIALLVQNSDGADMLKVDDAGKTTVVSDNTGNDNAFEINTSSSGLFKLFNSNSVATPVLTLGHGSKDTRLSMFNTIYIRANGVDIAEMTSSEVRIGSGSGARLAVKGSGATSATSALLVQNSAGTELLKVRDDGWVDLPGVLNGSAIRANTLQVDSVNFKVDGTNNYFQSQFSKNIFGADNANAEASAVLQADSTTQGFLPPRMAEGERDAISSPAAGLMVYNTDANQMNYWNGSTWIAF